VASVHSLFTGIFGGWLGFGDSVGELTGSFGERDGTR
jgi:hypothetical protein